MIGILNRNIDIILEDERNGKRLDKIVREPKKKEKNTDGDSVRASITYIGCA